jgi:FkbM family methyltransferase
MQLCLMANNKNNISGKQLLNSLQSVEKLATGGKLRRIAHNPYKYFSAILFRQLLYPFVKKEKPVDTLLFSGRKITVALPASTDIYLTGGKSHISEIKLARYLIQNLQEDSVFIDVGAHYGYFTLIAAEMITRGRIFAFEPSESSFKLLEMNTRNIEQASIFNKAVSAVSGTLEFFEFDNLHSEYNSASSEQFENESWFTASTTRKTIKEAVSLADFCRENNIMPDFIKIDVEGLENKVIKGLLPLLHEASALPVIIMEYLEAARNNTAHGQAHQMLLNAGYQSHIINKDGTLTALNDIEQHLKSNELESDNIVYC